VVRELVAASGGDLRVMSAQGIGTRVQIEWPATAMAQEKAAGANGALRRATASSQSPDEIPCSGTKLFPVWDNVRLYVASKSHL
jgi:hypothetical protein